MPAVTPEVYKLLRERIQWMLDASATSGRFSAETGSRMKLADVVAEGIVMDGEHTKPLRGASATTTINLEVTEREANMGENLHGESRSSLSRLSSLAIGTDDSQGAALLI